MAGYTGLLHDFGKYSADFQDRIRGAKKRAPHSGYGAAAASSLGMDPVAFAVAGHHAGIPNRVGLKGILEEWRGPALSLCQIAKEDCTALGSLLERRPAPRRLQNFDLFTRILFSVLVDADRLDSAGRTMGSASLEAGRRLRLLLRHVEALPKHDLPSNVTEARNRVLRDCLRAAEGEHRLLSLSVPTGGGKTLAAMAFALRRAALQPESYRRIIVVIPYLSIIEQNASIYETIFGSEAVLEHHSGVPVEMRRGGERFRPSSDDGENYKAPAERADTENWSAPLIVTTSLRFFESLFSNHPSDLRRAHNITRSIVILDEVQVIPPRLLSPLLGMIRELADDWGCSFVFSTATQPGFERNESSRAACVTNRDDPRWAPGTVREIIANAGGLYRELRRVTIDWRIDKPVDWPAVADWIAAEPQALCVVNTRAHARELYRLLQDRMGAVPGLFHLSTRMCAQHRLDRIGEIKRHLDRAAPCLVVSTQLIEAGVDIDFPAVFRAIGPLDAIIQAAGRADRNGRASSLMGIPAGRVVVFVPEDGSMPGDAYELAAALTLALARERNIQTDDPRSLRDFYNRLYGEQELGQELNEMRLKLQFATLAEEFEWIADRTQDVFVPYGEGAQYVEELTCTKVLTRDLRRKLQRFAIGLRPAEFVKGRRSLIRVGKEDIWVVSTAAYSEDLGFEIDGGNEMTLII